jgi:hypothetical protein
MALTLVTDEKRIRPAVGKIVTSFKGFRELRCKVHGDSKVRRVYWSSDDGIWLNPAKSSERRKKQSVFEKMFILRFGLQDAAKAEEEDERLVVFCPIELPMSGRNPQLGGAFAADESGQLFLVYRGGGKQEMNDGGDVALVTVICGLGSPTIVSEIASFVWKSNGITQPPR